MYGIAPENVPPYCLAGGRLVHDHTQWVCDRLQIEEQRRESAGTSMNLVTDAAFDVQDGELHRAEKRARRSQDYIPREGESGAVGLHDCSQKALTPWVPTLLLFNTFSDKLRFLLCAAFIAKKTNAFLWL
eukprot:CAMPEP_0197467680 /NCGR_PEP_ID=MMETSP1175-20131217/65693_1 /TAXON_ID=1003142 /ORGANISM="Triceratium dubium, Strain CCMP147" /LENGTH=129 /DNA_ID=CAMNT_0043003761 /DNA_START=373 /DNA_END=759 /DNA_ORIENTATION=-